jgi:TorA maturation chaperone TorD
MKDQDFFAFPVLSIEDQGQPVREPTNKKSTKKVVKSNVNNSLKTLKESIKELTVEKQNEMIKAWELKRNETVKELANANNKLKATVSEIFQTLFKTRGKSRTIIVKSPYEKKSYKFTYQLRSY